MNNFLTVKQSSNAAPKASQKGEPLGRVGVFIVLGFIGLVFAGALISAKGIIQNSDIQITQEGLNLKAEVKNEDQGNLAWSWFKIKTPDSPRFNNSSYLSERCAQAEKNQKPFIDSGSGQTTDISDLNSDKPLYLYCFTAKAQRDKSLSYGGYIVGNEN